MAPLARVLVHNLCIDYLRRHHYTLSIDTTDVPDLSNASADIERIERIDGHSGHAAACAADYIAPAPYRRHVDGRHSKAYGGTEAAVRKALSRARMAVKEQYLHNM